MKTSEISITKKDKEIFDRDGYWISPKLIDDEQIERLRKAHERLWEVQIDGDGTPMEYIYTMKQTDPVKLRKIDNAWWINDEVRSIVTDPLIGEMAANLLGVDAIRLWHDQVIYKPGTSGKETKSGNVGWHQDYGYWQCADNPNMITVWIALQDTDLSNGGMMTVLGSHEWGLVPDSNTFSDQNLQALRDKYSDGRKKWQEEPCILKAGQASFHHGLTFHGSGPNLSDEPRLSVVAHLMPDGTAYQPGVQWHPNTRLLGPRPYKGQRFDNEYFPLLFDRKSKRIE